MDLPPATVREPASSRVIAGQLPVWLDPADPDWKYVSERRLLIYLEHSIDEGTQWVVFEPNGEALWAAVQRSVSDFLYGEWREGVLEGQRAEEAFFVRCDATTMTQNDLDNGRLIVEIGVATVRPAEFVIFRIGQWTAAASSDSDSDSDSDTDC